MKRIETIEREKMVSVLQGEIRRNDTSRFYHRLHGVLLVAHGLSCRQTAVLLGDAPRTIAYWVRRFKEEGSAGLAEGERPGRPRRLSQTQLEEVGRALQKDPAEFGLGTGIWDGKAMSTFVARQWGISLGVRQSQRILRQLGSRAERPSVKLAPARSI